MRTLLFRLLLIVAVDVSIGLTWTIYRQAAQAPAVVTQVPAPTPARAATSAHAAWSPKVAFQYYETTGGDPEFLAEHVDWLMLRYGAEGLRQQVLDNGYSNVLPQYLQLFQISGPGPYANERDRCENSYRPVQNNVMWTDDFCELVHSHESWFLHNGSGERLYTKERNWDGSALYEYYMNPASEGFRRFWSEQVRRQQPAGWQSFFLDNVAATYAHLQQRPDNHDGEVKEYNSTRDWQLAVVGMLRSIRADFPDRQVWGNIIEVASTADAWDYYRGALDGIQEERFATNWVDQEPLSPEEWDAMLVRSERTLAEGKSVVLYGQGEANDFGRMRFALASYLLVATPDSRATFRYAQTTYYETLWWYPEYERDLGLPQGPRRQEGDRWVREFACGRVTVEPQSQRGSVEMRPCSDAP